MRYALEYAKHIHVRLDEKHWNIKEWLSWMRVLSDVFPFLYICDNLCSNYYFFTLRAIFKICQCLNIFTYTFFQVQKQNQTEFPKLNQRAGSWLEKWTSVACYSIPYTPGKQDSGITGAGSQGRSKLLKQNPTHHPVLPGFPLS